MNKENYDKVLAVIEANPQSWNQKTWHCGTQHCFAGHAQILAGKEPNDDTVRRDARQFLELTQNEAWYLFNGRRTLEDFKNYYCGNIYNRAGYDSDGYDREGYNCDGYDREGYDREGYDLGGHNSYGYNRNGYGCDGYDRDG